MPGYTRPVPSRLSATLARVEAVTPRSRLILLDLSGQSFPFQAGQAVMVHTPGSAGPRAYSIASSPERAAELSGIELLVGLGDTPPDQHPLTSLPLGSRVELEGPLGSFVFPPDATDTHLLFVAGGTGIAPLRAMLDQALRRHPAHRAALMYSARRADEFAFLPEFEALALAGALELHRTVTRDDDEWAGRRGRIGRAHFEAVLHDPGRTMCFVCGPPQMVDESVTTLTALGVPEAAIRREQGGKK